AVDCSVWVETGRLSSSDKKSACKADGSFELLVPHGRTVDLIAMSDSPSGFARTEGVVPGTSDIVMVLREGRSVTGRAVDDRGEPIAKFRVTALAHASEEDRIFCPGADGQFTLDGLHDGAWEICAEAEAHSRSTFHRTSLPADTEPIDLVLP